MSYTECGKCGYSALFRTQLFYHWFETHPEWKKYIPEKYLKIFSNKHHVELWEKTDWKKLGGMV